MSESGSVESAVGRENGNHKDTSNQEASAEKPNQETSAAQSVATEQGQNKEVSKEDQNKETAKEEKRRKKAERRRNRDFFAFIRKGEESSEDDEPLEGEELERELALHKRMRDQVIQDVKKYCGSPCVMRYMTESGTPITDEEFEKSELEIYAKYIPHPYPL